MQQMIHATTMGEVFTKLIYHIDLLCIGGPPNLSAAFSTSYLELRRVRTQKITVATLVFLILFTLISNIPGTVRASYDLSQVAYYDRVKGELNLTAQQETMLEKYGFTVLEMPYDYDPLYDDELLGEALSPWMRFENFYWQKVYNPDLPVFVTTDSILHLFHVVFDCSLRMMEYQTFYPMIYEVTEYSFQKSLSDYNSIPHDGSMKYWAVRNATVYFAVAMSLISGESVAVPSELAVDVDFFLNEIYAEETRFVSAAIWQYPEDIVELKYDFTQFTVRGHYLGVPRLERYFRAMMWHGNFPVCVPRSDETYTWRVSHIDEAAAVYARDILEQNTVYLDKWKTVYNVTSTLVGESDSINPLNLDTALHNVFGDHDQYLDLVAKPSGLTALRTELAKPEYEQRILGQAVVSNLGAKMRYPIVIQFMGQRYVPDSFMFQMLCWDNVGRNSLWEKRIMPKGLDVFAVLGSERARDLLTPDFDYANYGNNFAVLRNKFGNLTEEEWTHSSYMAWIYSLQSLVNVEYDSSYPEFMRNLAWKDEKLNTALGSWAQLRHDTLLYAKQTYIPAFVCSYPEAFVEPNPTFYSRMQQLTERTIEAISVLPAASSEPIVPYSSDTIILASLEEVKDITQKLEVISTKELAQQPLTSEEIDFIKQVVWTQGIGGSGGSNPMGWYAETIQNIAMAANYTALLDVPVIADVATFPPGDIEYPPQILHVGVGYVKALVVLYPMVDGTLVAAVGPVFSYYEFPLIGTKRLNDDEWKAMLPLGNSSEYFPEWVKDVYGMIDPIVPEHMTVTVLIATMAVATVALAVTRWRKPRFKRSLAK